MAVDCIQMASRHHPHHPYNYSRHSSFSSNNPYRFSSPAPSALSSSRRSIAESIPSLYIPRWTGSTEHYPPEPRRRDSTSSLPRRRSTHRTYSRHSQLVNPDIIDELDDVMAYSYHHEGPYDAVCPERNRISQHSPLEAVRESNEEALRATPRDKIIDSLHSHRPLDGTAFFPPGTTDINGQTYQYEEGSNMMNDFGNFMRLPGMVSTNLVLCGVRRSNIAKKFTDEDFKNDPFYNRPISNPFTSLRKKLSLKRNFKKRRSTA
ncbi:hypothetical protein N7532_010115 [Penicillium argentinense]|uniref:Pal1 cell morphology n=1 Tax=Penicillium argentinense TaxID=1131581 RepID=A0A9W9EPB4_9EURO|nr:uncharacterized protein N7532_010115 [Penicillium argentinense]KAJ5085344.1 hypothetical protein N7532_010115 [Penicillium argentinense]